MPFTISDEMLRNANITEQEARIELACRLFDIDKLALWPAAQLAALSRGEMEDALRLRKISIYRIDEGYWRQEKESLRNMEDLKHKVKA